MNISNKTSISILFWLNKLRVNKNNEMPIYMRVTVNGARVEISLQRFVEEKIWDPKAQRLIGKGVLQNTTNQFLDLTKGQVQTIYNQLLSGNQKITSKIIKEKLTGKEPTPNYKTILECFDFHNLKMKEKVAVNLISPKTHLRFQITKNKVEAFIKHQYKVNDKPLPELRLAFVTEFEHYLLTIDKLQSNTAHKYIKNLKKIMNMAVGLDWIPSNPFNMFKCSYTSPNREILTKEELEVLRLKKINIPRLAEVRDVFIFCCYTGFAYTDVYQFEGNALTIGIDGEYWLATNRQKTGTRESVPLLSIPLSIIEKYKDHPYCVSNNKLLPINSNQRYNAYLKELATICKIKKTLTTHIARHTFATTVTLANGVPIETVSSMLGHNNIRTTQIYAKVIEQKVSEDMKLLRSKLEGNNESKVLKIG